jgi:transcriptional regulator with GAF, ATPase, and Fis domain
VAQFIHRHSRRASRSLVSINCAALPANLLESELFGHVKGSFTGAMGDRKGRFELAGRGTICLDEIGDTSPAFQAKLLRVLQEREFHPVGGERVRRTEARVVAATHRPLERMVREGRFREDLYFRLRVVEIAVPPLRERRGDVVLLAEHLLREGAREMHVTTPVLAPDAVARLTSYDWPGNVRELENALTRALVLARGATLTTGDLALGQGGVAEDPASDEASAADQSLAAIERAHIVRVLQRARGNKRQACRVLRISRPRLDRLLEKHGIR